MDQLVLRNTFYIILIDKRYYNILHRNLLRICCVTHCSRIDTYDEFFYLINFNFNYLLSPPLKYIFDAFSHDSVLYCVIVLYKMIVILLFSIQKLLLHFSYIVCKYKVKCQYPINIFIYYNKRGSSNEIIMSYTFFFPANF